MATDGALRLAAGERISGTPVDCARDPLVGEMMTLSLHALAVRRADPLVGKVAVHFPELATAASVYA